MSRKLASIQKVLDIQPISGADKIECVSVLGWKIVAQKGIHIPGQLVVYIEIDSVLPERPEFLFLKDRKFRIKTIKLRGQISQGICFPLAILPEGTQVEEGLDVTDILGVSKYEIPIPPQLRGLIKGSFPGYLRKTDEPRIQSFPEVLNEIKEKYVYITEKVDGTSVTFSHKDGETEVCSRNLSLKETEDNLYWKIFRKYNIEKILKELGNFAIQGEIAGPGIQKNPLGLQEHQLFIFNVYDINRHCYENFFSFNEICNRYNLPKVKILWKDVKFVWSIENLLEMARGTYESNKPREGIVIRPMLELYSSTLKDRLSFKVINNDYLLKCEE